MSFKPNFSEIKQGKNHLFIVRYAQNSTIKVKHIFSEISGTYLGVTVDGFTENIRGLLCTIPNFFQVLSVSPRKELAELGLIETEPNALEVILYGDSRD